MVSQGEKFFYACMLCGLAHTNEGTSSWLAILIRECYEFDGGVHMKGKKITIFIRAWRTGDIWRMLTHTNEETSSWLAILIRECYKFDGRVHMKGKKITIFIWTWRTGDTW